MYKALITASVLIGALFFSPFSTSQEGFSCPVGGTFNDHPELGPICSTPQPTQAQWKASSIGREYIGRSPAEAYEALAATFAVGGGGCYGTGTIERDLLPLTEPLPETPNTYQTSIRVETWCRLANSLDRMGINTFPVGMARLPDIKYCPPDNYPNLQSVGVDENNEFFCWISAVDEPPECPEDNIGGCDPVPDNCTMGGNGLLVCEEDPNDKCDVSDSSTIGPDGSPVPVYSNCQSGCGFVQDRFFCTEKEDDGIDLSKCLVVGTGYVCPSDDFDPDVPDINDDITDPNKPLADMKKSDFKDVNIGVETRLDASNALLQSSAQSDALAAKGISDLNSKALASNGKLDAIASNTGATAGNTKEISDALKGDAFEIADPDGSGILSGLGLTGDENITDLEKNTITLDTYRDQFNWSAGSSSCPADRPMNLLNRTFYIEWGPYCEAFTVMGYFIHAAALLISGFIAFGVRR